MTLTTVASSSAARARADRIRQGLEALAPDIVAAWNARDWEALGYGSWNEYVVGEFGGQLRLGRAERQEAVRELRQAGMSTPAIATTLGISNAQAWRDATSPNVEVPDRVIGLDGHSRPSTRGVEPRATPLVPALWPELTCVLEDIEQLLITDAPAIAAAVPDRRKASTARRLRTLGTGLGRIAWTLEGMEESDDDAV